MASIKKQKNKYQLQLYQNMKEQYIHILFYSMLSSMNSERLGKISQSAYLAIDDNLCLPWILMWTYSSVWNAYHLLSSKHQDIKTPKRQKIQKERKRTELKFFEYYSQLPFIISTSQVGGYFSNYNIKVKNSVYIILRIITNKRRWL